MTLVDDLQALDLTAIVNARATITLTADGPQLQATLSGAVGAVGAVALGDIGTALTGVRALAEDPQALFDEVLAALPSATAFSGLGELDLDGWADAVREGAELVAALVDALGGDFSRLGDVITGAAGDLLPAAREALDDYTQVGVGDLADMRRLVDDVSGGVAVQPQAFARLALDVLLPGGAAAPARMRAAVSGVLDGAAAIDLPEGRIAGLLDAHAAVARAAQAGDVLSVQIALAALAQARDATIAAIEGDVRFAVERLNAIQTPQALAVIAEASEALDVARTGTLEFLERLRSEIAGARSGIAAIDASAARAAIVAFIDGAEARAQELLLDPVEERVAAVEAWVRGLFAHLPLRALRAQVSALVEGAVAAIEAADLDAPAAALRARLAALETQIAEVDVGAAVSDALEAVEEVISGALTAISEALSAIGAAVNTIADSAVEVVEQAVALLEQLVSAIEEARRAIDELPIEQAQQEVIDAIRELRGKAEELFAGASLPEGLRPLVEQLVDELKDVDFEGALLGPVDNALAQFRVLEQLGVVDAIADIQQTLSNLVPAQLAAEIQAQLDAVLDGIRAFRPEGIRALVEGFLDEVAREIEAIDLDPVRDLVHQPFAVVLDAFDELKPTIALAPVLSAYDELVGATGLPDPVTASEGLLSAAAGAGMALAPSHTGLAEQLAEQAERVAPTLPPDIGGMPRPGDVIRLLGWLPGRLRAALAPLGPEARRAAVDEVAALVGGLAADLRRMRAEVLGAGERLDRGLDALLAPLAAAQLRAQLQLSASFSASAGGVQLQGGAELDLEASLDLVASAGPGQLRTDLGTAMALINTTVDGVAGGLAAGDTAIGRAAAALERSPLVALADDIDAFLAALDPEPLAAELDALMDAAVALLPALLAEIGDELEATVRRAQQLLLDHNPAALLARFLRVLDSVREELDVLNPHVLARQLDAIHDAARATLESYDPAVLVDDAEALLDAVATAIRGADLSGVPGAADLAELGAAVARVEDAVPTRALADAGAALADAGAALRAIDLTALVAEVDAVPTRVEDAMHAVVAAVKNELIALLGALKYSQTEASLSVSGSASGSVG